MLADGRTVFHSLKNTVRIDKDTALFRTVFVSIDQRPSPAPATSTLPLRTAWLVLTVVVIADIMDLIDSSIASLAGPSIRADLGGGQVTVQWVLSAYTAAFALGLVTSGSSGTCSGAAACSCSASPASPWPRWPAA